MPPRFRRANCLCSTASPHLVRVQTDPKIGSRSPFATQPQKQEARQLGRAPRSFQSHRTLSPLRVSGAPVAEGVDGGRRVSPESSPQAKHKRELCRETTARSLPGESWRDRKTIQGFGRRALRRVTSGARKGLSPTALLRELCHEGKSAFHSSITPCRVPMGVASVGPDASGRTRQEHLLRPEPFH